MTLIKLSLLTDAGVDEKITTGSAKEADGGQREASSGHTFSLSLSRTHIHTHTHTQTHTQTHTHTRTHTYTHTHTRTHTHTHIHAHTHTYTHKKYQGSNQYPEGKPLWSEQAPAPNCLFV